MKLQPSRKQNSSLRTFSFQALPLTCTILILIRIFDLMYPEVTLAPLAGTILVFGLSLLFTPSVVAVCCLLIAAFVVFSLASVPSFSLSNSEQLIRFCIRSVTFCIAAGVGLAACAFRCRLQNMLQQSRELLGHLPTPVILSNAAGRVVWSNSAARSILGSAPPEGRLFLDVIPSDGTPISYPLLFSEPQTQQFLRAAVPDYDLHFYRLQTGIETLLVTSFLSKSSNLLHSHGQTDSA